MTPANNAAGVPSGWQVASLGEIEALGFVKLGRGKIISKRDVADNPGDYPIYSSAGQNNGEFARYGSFDFDEELITWSIDGGGRTFYRKKHRFSVTNVGGWLRILNDEVFGYKYLHFALTYLHSNVIFDWSRKAHPSVIRLVYDSIPIPPVVEQEQIVEILEEQFSHLDAAAASIAAVRRKADQFRRSLLNTAFAGGLSRGGARGMSPVLPSGWSFLPLGSCGAWFGGGTPSKSNKKFWTNGTIPWLSPKDMGPSVIVETQDKITDEAVKGSPTALVASNSVAVVVRSGILERRLPVALVPFVTTLNQDMKALEVRGDLLPKWVLYALQAFNNEVLSECRKAGTTVASIEFPRLRDFEIPVAPLDEQAEIVRILEEQFSHQTAILAIADEVEHRLSALRRSLLHAAFTGELTKEWREKNNG